MALVQQPCSDTLTTLLCTLVTLSTLVILVEDLHTLAGRFCHAFAPLI